MDLTLAGIGLAALVLFAIFHWRDYFRGIRAVLAFGGIILVAGAASGALGFNLLIKLVTWIEALLSDLTYAAIHLRAGAFVLFLFLGAWFAIDMHPKNKASRATGWVGLALAIVIIVGVPQLPWLQKVPPAVRNGVQNAQTTVQGH